jgi:signal transduction histidine kinase
MEANSQRRWSVTARVWTIVVVGIASGVLSIVVLLWARHDIQLARRTTESASEELLRLVDLHAAGTIQAREGLLAGLKEPAAEGTYRTWSTMLGEAHLGVSELLATARSGDVLEQLQESSADLLETRQICIDWRESHDRIEGAYAEARAGVSAALRDLRVTLESLEGQARLEAMMSLKEAHSGRANPLEELRRITQDQTRVNQVVRCKTELSEFTLLCWTLLETEDCDVLTDLKDNDLASSVSRLNLELQSLQAEVAGEADDQAEAIETALFGVGSRFDAAHQTIELGTGGAYAAAVERIRSHQERTKLIASVATQVERMGEMRADLLIAGQTVLKRTADQAEVVVETAILRMIVLGGVAGLIFTALAVRTGRAVHRYVVALSDSQLAEEVARREMESANEVLQSALEERSRLESQLVHAQKMESIGQLAAGIAHEINTPIQYVGDNTRFVRDSIADLLRLVRKYAERLDPDSPSLTWEERVEELQALSRDLDLDFLSEEMPAAIDQTLDGVARVAEIVRAMKDFSHPGEGVKTPTDINRAIESTLTVCRNRWKYVAVVQTDLDEALPVVPCLIGEFNQVILNLVVNAADAIGEQRRDDDDELGLITVRTCLCGPMAEVRVSDTGGGMTEAVKSRIFDPFYTTKDVGRGTGQGLAISHDVIVSKHGGTLEVETEEGAGSTFIIRLPLEADVQSWKSEAA